MTQTFVSATNLLPLQTAPDKQKRVGTRRVAFFLLCCTVFLQVWFPKGGIKVADTPLTIGNLAFALAFVVCLTAFVFGRRLQATPMTVPLLVAVGYFFVRLLFAQVNGQQVFPYLISLAISPLIFFMVTSVIRSDRELNLVGRIIVAGFFFVALYSMAQVVLGINAVAIPGLTVNATDYASGPAWYLDKSNKVGDFTKIPSTFQNGNLLGVNLILIFPIAYEFMRPRLKAVGLLLFVAAVILTLSRSAWLGLAVYIFVRFVFTTPKTLAGLLGRVMAVVGVVVAAPVFIVAFPQVAARLLGSNITDLFRLSGRTDELWPLLGTTLGNPLALVFGPMGVAPFDGSAYEMTYFAIYMVAGLIGVVLFVFLMVRAFTSLKGAGNRIAAGVRLSILCYCVTAFIEGGMWLPPTAIVLWLVIGIGFVAIRLDAQKFSVPINREVGA